MRLSTLLQNIIAIPPQVDCEIAYVALDSRKIEPNALFLAVKGFALDGREYVTDAITRGAVAILVETEDVDASLTFIQAVPLIPVLNLKNRVGEIAAHFYNQPANKLRMIGVTGTNGKTSCTHFIAQGLQSPCGVIGTLGSGLYGHLGEAALTTPDAVTIQALLAQFVLQQVQAVAMEVSSHSIDQGRINGIDYEMGVFTNLTQDHLDYHGDMCTYAAVKRRFLAQSSTKHLIINADDPYGKKWIAEFVPAKSVYAYSCHELSTREERASYIYTTDVHLSLQGITASVFSPWGDGQLQASLIGQFNLSNLLAALCVLCCYGIPFKEVLKRLARLKSIPGRMQTIAKKNMPLVVVDYAHTPDSLEKALQALRGLTNGKLICVFGCGGNRDAGKRPLMAHIAESIADQIIVTNDNPRHERPEDIVEAILQGFTNSERVSVVLDRSKAIKNSIQWAASNDCVLIAGKGAEHYQQIGDEKIYFDDVEEASKCLAEKMNVIVVK